MWPSEPWEEKKHRHSMSPYKRIDKFLFSTLKSTQMGMELQKMSRDHAKCDNGTEKKNPKRIKHMRSYANNWQYCCEGDNSYY